MEIKLKIYYIRKKYHIKINDDKFMNNLNLLTK